MILDITEAEADLVLASHDPLADLAVADPTKLNALLADLKPASEALAAMLADLAEENGAFDVAEAGFPDLAAGDRMTLRTMNFTLAEEQEATVKEAIAAAKAAGPFVDTGNENSNGNALARMAEAYLGLA